MNIQTFKYHLLFNKNLTCGNEGRDGMCRGHRLSRAGASHGPGPPALKALASAASGQKVESGGAAAKTLTTQQIPLFGNLRAAWGSRDRA